MEQTNPTSKEPVSPINIFAGVKLYFKKATTAPAREKATIESAIWSVKKNQVPSVTEIKVEILPDKPFIPSIKLKALMMTKMVKIDKTILTVSGNS